MNRRLVLVALLLASLHVAVAAWFCFNGLLNADEAFYGLAAREATAGRVPYRDFGFTQTPLVPYVQGAVMRLIGFGFLEQRIAAGLWAVATMLVGARWLARRASPAVALWFAGLLTLSAGWMYNAHLGKTYAVAGCVVMLLAACWLGDVGPRARLAALSLLGAIAIGCRLPLAPFVGVLWIGLALEQRSTTNVFLSLVACAGSLGFVLGGFAAADWENFRFWVVDFHRESVALRNFFTAPSEAWGLSPALWLLAGAAAASLMRQRNRRPPARETWLVCALGAGLAANLLPRGGYAEYAAPFVPASLLLALVLVHRAWPERVPVFGAAVATVSLASAWIFPAPHDRDIYTQVRGAAQFISRAVPEGVELGGPATLLALETGRPVHPRLLMTPFSFSDTKEEAWAAAHHLATPAWLTARMADRALPVYALTTQRRWNFGRSMPDFEFTKPELLQHWAQQLEHDYVSVYANGAFAIFARRDALAAENTKP